MAAALLGVLETVGDSGGDREPSLRAKLENATLPRVDTPLTLALVGAPGAGRRTLINALLGERVLAARRGGTVTAVQFATAPALTARSGGTSSAVPRERSLAPPALADISIAEPQARGALGRLWRAIGSWALRVLLLLPSFLRKRWIGAELFARARDLDGASVEDRLLAYPARHLPNRVTLLDLPGFEPTHPGTIDRVRRQVAERADALVLVTDIRTPLDSALASGVRDLQDLAPLVLVVLTKADELLEGAGSANGEASARIARALREATDTVRPALAGGAQPAAFIALAAEQALRGAGAAALRERKSLRALARLLEQMRDEAALVRARRDALQLRTSVPQLAQACTDRESYRRTRLAALEGQRIRDPAEFRAELLARVGNAIEDASQQVVTGAVASLRAAIEALRAGWRDRVLSCGTREAVEACVKAIDEDAPSQLSAVLEQTAERVARELHESTETLRTWAIEEVHVRYQLVRRQGMEALSPVASELTRDDLEPDLALAPVDGAMDAFERKRVGYGLGGVAAGATLGTLVAPGIGTAIGAFLGVFAGLLQGLDTLKRDCVARIERRLSDAESHAQAQLATRRPDLARDIRLALEESLDDAMRVLGEAIARLRALEARAIEREHAELRKLAGARRTLDKCGERLAKLSDAPLVATRGT